jgi:general stress protein 26
MTFATTKAAYWQDGWRRYFKGPDDSDYVMIFVRPTRTMVPVVLSGIKFIDGIL